MLSKRWQESGKETTHLVAPEEDVASAILEPMPDVKELLNPVLPDMVRVLLGFRPVERGADCEQSHPVASCC